VVLLSVQSSTRSGKLSAGRGLRRRSSSEQWQRRLCPQSRSCKTLVSIEIWDWAGASLFRSLPPTDHFDVEPSFRENFTAFSSGGGLSTTHGAIRPFGIAAHISTYSIETGPTIQVVGGPLQTADTLIGPHGSLGRPSRDGFPFPPSNMNPTRAPSGPC
jgi:hypothetical protein